MRSHRSKNDSVGKILRAGGRVEFRRVDGYALIINQPPRIVRVKASVIAAAFPHLADRIDGADRPDRICECTLLTGERGELYGLMVMKGNTAENPRVGFLPLDGIEYERVP